MFYVLGLIGGVALFSLPFTIPHHPLALPGFSHEWAAAACGLLMCTPLLKCAAWQDLTWPGMLLAPLALLLLLSLQASLGMVLYPSEAFVASLYLVWAFLLAFTTRALIAHYGLRRIAIALAIAMLAGGLINAVAAMLQHWQLSSFFGALIEQSLGATAYGNIAQPNHFADQLALAFASLLFLAASKRLSLVTTGLIAICLLTGLSLSTSRSSWLYMMALPMLALAFHLHQRNPTSRRLAQLALIGLILFFAIQQVLSFLGTNTPAARIAAHIGSGDMLRTRLEMWRHALQMFTDAPWLGVGFQNFTWHNFVLTAGDAQSMFTPELISSQMISNNAHNLVFHLLAEFGAIILVLLALSAYWFYRNIRSGITLEAWWALALLTILLTHSTLEFPLWFAHFLGPFVVLLAFFDRTSLSAPYHRALPITATMALVFGFLTLALILYSYLALDRAKQLTLRPMDQPSLEAFSSNLQQAQQFGLFSRQVDLYLTAQPIEADNPKRMALQLAVNSRALRHMPTYTVWYRQIVLLVLNGKQAQARSDLELLARIYPSILPHYAQSLRLLGQEKPILLEYAALAERLARKQ